MKTLLLLTAISAISYAQPNAKPAPVAAEEKITSLPPVERMLTEDEVLKLSLVNSQIEVLKAKYDIPALEKKYADFRKELDVVVARQEAIVKAVCGSVGVPEDKIKTGECHVSLGVDAAGAPLNGQDGSPIPSKVARAKPQGMPALPVVEKK